MATQEVIKGRIIRILDNTTVVINLGSREGVGQESTFKVLGDLENIVDPENGEVLGAVNIVKARVKAFQVFERFSVASSTWNEIEYTGLQSITRSLSRDYVEKKVGEQLRVKPEDVKPWKAISEVPVKVGDLVEVVVQRKEPPAKVNANELKDSKDK
jgi:hypothetical protein